MASERGGVIGAVACSLLLAAAGGCAAQDTVGEPSAEPPSGYSLAHGPGTAGSGPREAILSWDTPGRRADGSCLSDLTGFLIRYGTDPQNLVQIERPTMDELDCVATGTTTPCHEVSHCTFPVEPLAPGTWYFVIHAYDNDGRVSAPSGIIQKVIEDPRSNSGDAR